MNRAGGTTTGNGMLKAYGVTAAQLSGMLASDLRAPVQDRTGTAELFDAVLQYQPLDPRPDTSGRPAAADDRPSIFTALKEQLGLTLNKTKVPVNVLVIDKLHRTPAEN